MNCSLAIYHIDLIAVYLQHKSKTKSSKMTEQNLLLKINELPSSQWIKLDKDKFISSTRTQIWFLN